jgi:hypothetical protein
MGWKDEEKKVLSHLDEAKATWIRDNVNLDADNDLKLKTRDQLIDMFKKIVKPKKPGEPKRKALKDAPWGQQERSCEIIQ